MRACQPGRAEALRVCRVPSGQVVRDGRERVRGASRSLIPQIHEMHPHPVDAKLQTVVLLEHGCRVHALHRLGEHVQQVVPASEVRDVRDVHARSKGGPKLAVCDERRAAFVPVGIVEIAGDITYLQIVQPVSFVRDACPLHPQRVVDGMPQPCASACRKGAVEIRDDVVRHRVVGGQRVVAVDDMRQLRHRKRVLEVLGDVPDIGRRKADDRRVLSRDAVVERGGLGRAIGGGEEKRHIGHDAAAEVAAPLLAIVRGLGQALLGGQEFLGVERLVPEVAVRRAAERIAAGLGDGADDPTDRPAEFGRAADGRDLELTDGVLAVLHLWKSERLVGVPQAVDNQRAVFVACAGDLQTDPLAGGPLVDVHARRQQRVVEKVARDSRQRLDLIARNDGREIHLRALDDGRLTGDRHCLADIR